MADRKQINSIMAEMAKELSEAADRLMTELDQEEELEREAMADPKHPGHPVTCQRKCCKN